MQSHAQGVVVELLYVNNSTVERLTDFLFKNLKIINLQISNAGLQDVAPNAFRGLEDTLQNLNLAGNQLRCVQLKIQSLNMKHCVIVCYLLLHFVTTHFLGGKLV